MANGKSRQGPKARAERLEKKRRENEPWRKVSAHEKPKPVAVELKEKRRDQAIMREFRKAFTARAVPHTFRPLHEYLG